MTLKMVGATREQTLLIERNARCYESAGIMLTTACNLRCPRCSQGDKSQWHGSLPQTTMEQHNRILDRLAEQSVHLRMLFYTGGEPTLCPQLKEMISETKRRSAADRIVVVTNGVDRNIEDYGEADVVSISDYGAINRLDAQRLRKQGGRRVVVHRVVHDPWPVEPDDSVDDIPADCRCVRLEFCGDRVWPCAMAEMGNAEGSLSVEENFWYRFVMGDPCRQAICHGCLANKRRAERRSRPVTFEWGVWGSPIGGTIVVPWRLNWLRRLYRAAYYGKRR